MSSPPKHPRRQVGIYGEVDVDRSIAKLEHIWNICAIMFINERICVCLFSPSASSCWRRKAHLVPSENRPEPPPSIPSSKQGSPQDVSKRLHTSEAPVEFHEAMEDAVSEWQALI
jgi:hypothetical protein